MNRRTDGNLAALERYEREQARWQEKLDEVESKYGKELDAYIEKIIDILMTIKDELDNDEVAHDIVCEHLEYYGLHQCGEK